MVKMTRVKLDFVFDATTTTVTRQIQENGFIRKMIVVTPTMTNSPTSTLTIKDADSLATYTGSALNANTTTAIGSSIAAAETGCVPVNYNDSLTITLSGAAGASGGTVSVVCFIGE